MNKFLIPTATLFVLLTIVAWMANVFEDRVEPEILMSGELATANSFYTVEQGSYPLFESIPATLRAKQQTVISSRILARVVSVNARAGDSVKKGDLLIALEKSDLLSRAAQASERVKSVTALRNEAESQFTRIQEMLQRKLVAVAELDQAKAQFESLNADLAAAVQAHKEALTAVEYSQIVAPIDGRVVDRFTEPGDIASPGEKLMALYNPLSLRVEAQVREQLAVSLTLGQALEVFVPVLDKTIPAAIEERVPAANPGARSFLVKAKVDYDEKLLPGMFVRLQIPRGNQAGILIPSHLVTLVGQLNIVWIYQAGELEKRIIRLGRQLPDDQVVVSAGLHPGDKLSLVLNE
jgi:membrane fusion protein (multidrug efflux system)